MNEKLNSFETNNQNEPPNPFIIKPDSIKNLNETVQQTSDIETFATKLGEKLLFESKIQELRRNSSSNNLAVHTRKASLPAEYIASNAGEQLKLTNDWCRENVAHLAHEA
ncbi:hypothetical protein BLA29_011994, partial [Euroglyphus maynei]